MGPNDFPFVFPLRMTCVTHVLWGYVAFDARACQSALHDDAAFHRVMQLKSRFVCVCVLVCFRGIVNHFGKEMICPACVQRLGDS